MIKLDLRDLITLLNYYWLAVNSSRVGDLGLQTYEETVFPIAHRNQVEITPDELKTLIYHMKQAQFEIEAPTPSTLRDRPYNKILKSLADDIPHLFSVSDDGEVTFLEES